MKKLFGGLFLIFCSPAWAGLSIGLGTAVVKKASEQAVDFAKASKSPSTAPSTPSACSATPFSVSLIDLALPFHIEPLGHLAPAPHTFPTDHTYYQMNKSSSDTSTFNIYAPSDITVTYVISTTYLNLSPPYTDYGLDFIPCAGMIGRLGHIHDLSSELQNKIGPLTDCSSSSGLQTCTKVVSVSQTAGEVIGIQKGLLGNLIVGMDFGVFDTNNPATPFISPERRGSPPLHIDCPYDLFVDPIRTNLEARFARYDGLPRTVAPFCGDANQDIPLTAQGNWYPAGTPHSVFTDESNNLALVHDNVIPSTGAISFGPSSSASGLTTGLYYFNPTSAGFVNRDFPGVTSDGNVYCYDSFSNFSPPNVILIQMPTSSTLRIERQNLADCSGGSWTMTSNATDFER